jgi:hypothetical protein
VAELSLQKFVCGSTSGESKKGCNSFWSSIIFSHQCQHWNTKVGRKDKPGLNNMKKTETSIEENSLYRCLFVALSVSNRRWGRRVFDSSGSLPIKTMRDSTCRQWRCCKFLDAAKITKLLKGFRQPSTNHNNIEILTWSCVDCQKNWASYQERKDWRIYHGFHNNDESWIRRWLSIEKPQSFCLVRSCHNINCSNVFAKIDIHLPLKFVDQHLLDSRLVAPTSIKLHVTTVV